jgi:hypothetical protein
MANSLLLHGSRITLFVILEPCCLYFNVTPSKAPHDRRAGKHDATPPQDVRFRTSHPWLPNPRPNPSNSQTSGSDPQSNLANDAALHSLRHSSRYRSPAEIPPAIILEPPQASLPGHPHRASSNAPPNRSPRHRAPAWSNSPRSTSIEDAEHLEMHVSLPPPREDPTADENPTSTHRSFACAPTPAAPTAKQRNETKQASQQAGPSKSPSQKPPATHHPHPEAPTHRPVSPEAALPCIPGSRLRCNRIITFMPEANGSWRNT